MSALEGVLGKRWLFYLLTRTNETYISLRGFDGSPKGKMVLNILLFSLKNEIKAAHQTEDKKQTTTEIITFL